MRARDYIKTIAYKYWNKVKNTHWGNFFSVFVGIAVAIALVKYYKVLLENAGKTIIENHDSFVYYIIPACIVIGYAHYRVNKKMEYNIMGINFLSSPLLASSLTALTYGVVIDSSLALLYIVLYDKETILKYPYLDSNLITCTLILAIIWGANGILNMLGKIFWPSKAPRGTTEKKGNEEN